MNGDIGEYCLISAGALSVLVLYFRAALAGPFGGPFKETLSPRMQITAGNKLKEEQCNITQQFLLSEKRDKNKKKCKRAYG